MALKYVSRIMQLVVKAAFAARAISPVALIINTSRVRKFKEHVKNHLYSSLG